MFLVDGLIKLHTRCAELRDEESGQGTVEYAILVGMLVIIGITAILFVSGKIAPLWQEIQDAFAKI